MLRFYCSLIREIPAVLRNSAEAWAFWILTIAAPAVVVLNPQLQQWIDTPQFSRWFVLVPIGASVFYGLLRVNFGRFEVITRECDEARRQLEYRGRPITRDDWMAMASEFRSLPRGDIRAIWSQVGSDESWSIFGHLEPARQFEALCKRAGAMLLASPRVASSLSPSVRCWTNPAHRWLELLREQPNVVSTPGSGRYEGTPAKTDTFEGLPEVSWAVCVQCSAEEI